MTSWYLVSEEAAMLIDESRFVSGDDFYLAIKPQANIHFPVHKNFPANQVCFPEFAGIFYPMI